MAAPVELEIPVTLPGPEVTHRWQGRTLVDHDGEPLGSVETIYLDKATNQPEWALLGAGATGPSRTYVPLVNAGEEGDTVRVPFAKTLIEGAPRMPADRELSEDQEQEPAHQAAFPPANPSPPNRRWQLVDPSPRKSRCPPAPPRWRPESPR
jgi:PRC-barrel domain